MLIVIHSNRGKILTDLSKKSSEHPRNFSIVSVTKALHMIFLSGLVFSFASGFAHFSNLHVVFISWCCSRAKEPDLAVCMAGRQAFLVE